MNRFLHNLARRAAGLPFEAAIRPAAAAVDTPWRSPQAPTEPLERASTPPPVALPSEVAVEPEISAQIPSDSLPVPIFNPQAVIEPVAAEPMIIRPAPQEKQGAKSPPPLDQPPPRKSPRIEKPTPSEPAVRWRSSFPEATVEASIKAMEPRVQMVPPVPPILPESETPKLDPPLLKEIPAENSVAPAPRPSRVAAQQLAQSVASAPAVKSTAVAPKIIYSPRPLQLPEEQPPPKAEPALLKTWLPAPSNARATPERSANPAAVTAPIHVKVGPIEVRVQAPPSPVQRTPAEPNLPGGFDDYTQLRTYAGAAP